MLKKVINNILHVKINDLKLKGNLIKTLKIGIVLIVLSVVNIILNG